jgi:hypothetical protein
MNRTQQFFTGLILLGIALLVLTGLPALAQSGGVAQLIGGTEASLREFILRTEGLLAATDSDTAVTIRIETLPEDLPFELPLPEDSTPVGGITVASPGGNVYRLLVDTRLEPAAVLDFYAEALDANPWRRLNMPGTGGFASGTIANDMYCYGPETTVNINVWRLPSDTTDLQIYINEDTGAVLCGDGALPSSQPEQTLLPQLPDVPGVTVVTAQQNMNGRELVLSTATLRSDLAPADILAGYATALEAEGWASVQSARADGVAWSSWTLSAADGLPWQASLTITASAAGENLYLAQLNLSPLPAG